MTVNRGGVQFESGNCVLILHVLFSQGEEADDIVVVVADYDQKYGEAYLLGPQEHQAPARSCVEFTEIYPKLMLPSVRV